MSQGARTTLKFAVPAALLIGLVYANSLDNLPTNWDDAVIFSNPVFHGLNLPNLSEALTFQAASTFQPLRDISYMMDFSIWHTPQSLLIGLHLHNLLLYIVLAIACFLFLRRLCKALGLDDDRALFLAAVSSLIYAVHPVHVESVTWLYARKEPLLGLFTFLSLWAFLKARIDQRHIYYLLSALAVILAILSKPTAVVLPGVILLLEIMLRVKRHEPIPWLKGGLLLLPLAGFAAWQAIRLLVMMRSAGGVLPYHGGTFATNLLAVSQIFVAYFGLSGFTLAYAADYPIRLYTSLAQWQAWAFLLLNVAVLTGAVAAAFKRQFLFPFIVFWHYIFILPVSNIVPISQVLADRYALLPSLSWCVLVGYGLTSLRYARIRSFGTMISPSFPRLLAYGLSCALIASYAAMSVRQNDVWQDGRTLWEHTLDFYPHSFPANVNLSLVYLNQSRYREAERLCINALANLPQANLFGAAHMALNNLATAQMGQGKYRAAISNYAQVLKRDHSLTQARLGLAHCFWMLKDYPQAYTQYRALLENGAIATPRIRAEVLYRAGYAAWKLGLRDEAKGYLEQSALADPDNLTLARLLLETYTSMGLTAQGR